MMPRSVYVSCVRLGCVTWDEGQGGHVAACGEEAGSRSGVCTSTCGAVCGVGKTYGCITNRLVKERGQLVHETSYAQYRPAAVRVPFKRAPPRPLHNEVRHGRARAHTPRARGAANHGAPPTNGAVQATTSADPQGRAANFAPRTRGWPKSPPSYPCTPNGLPGGRATRPHPVLPLFATSLCARPSPGARSAHTKQRGAERRPNHNNARRPFS